MAALRTPQGVISSMPHQENECPQHFNHFWSCVLGNQGIAWRFELIIEQLTIMLDSNAIDKRSNTNYNIIDITICKPWTRWIMHIEYEILIRYYYHEIKSSTLCESTVRPTGQPAENLPNWDRLEGYHQMVSFLTILVHWQPAPPFRHRVGSDQDWNPQQQSRTNVHTSRYYSECIIWLSFACCPISYYWLVDMRSCKMCILINTPCSDLQYWVHCNMYICKSVG